jgi:uncharacterized oxidoreductase
MEAGMPLIAEGELRELLQSLFTKAGTPAEEARIVADHLVDANLAGHDSHGVIRAPGYVRQMRNGVTPQSAYQVVRETPASAVIDAKGGLGIVAARLSMEMAMEKAKRGTLGAVGVHHCGHTGRLGDFVERAAAEGVIGICMLNGGGRFVAPHGGTERRLPPNPIAVGLPRRDGPPIMLDMTSSVVAGGKIEVKRARGESLPEGWMIDGEGKPLTDPEQFFGPPHGAVLPLGAMAFGHKGYGLGFVIDCLAGGLTWAGCSRPEPTRGANGFLSMAIKIEDFLPLDEFETEVEHLVAWTKSSRQMPGFGDVVVPGEPEARAREQRRREGIPVEERTWAALTQAADEVGVAIDSRR